MMESLGNRLRQLRQNNRLRQDQVASLVGVNKNTMCSYENDVRQPSYEILVRLATIYRVSTDYLLGCESKRTVDVSGLTPKEIQTITELVADMSRLLPVIGRNSIWILCIHTIEFDVFPWWILARICTMAKIGGLYETAQAILRIVMAICISMIAEKMRDMDHATTNLKNI